MRGAVRAAAFHLAPALIHLKPHHQLAIPFTLPPLPTVYKQGIDYYLLHGTFTACHLKADTTS